MTPPKSRRALLALVALVPLLMGDECAEGTTPEPELVITFPPDGYFTNDSSVTVTGTARRGGGTIAGVFVNGVSVLPLQGDPQDGSFSTQVTLDPNAIFNPIFVRLQLSGGTQIRRRVIVIAGDGATTGFVADGSPSPDSVALRLNDSGLDSVEPILPSLVNLDLATLLPPGTLVIDNFCYQDSIFGCLGRVDATVAGNPPPSVGSVAIDVDSQTNFVEGDVRLNNLFIKTNVVAVTGVGFSCDVTITAATTDVVGDYGLEPDAVDPEFLDVFQIGNASLTFGSFNDSTDCAGFFGGIIEFFINLLIGDIQDLVEPRIESFLNTPDANGNTPVAAAVETALAGVEISGPVGEAFGVTLDTTFSSVPEDVDGVTLISHSTFLADPAFAGTCFDDVTGMEVQPVDPCSTADPCPEGETCVGPAGECVADPASPDLLASYDVVEATPVFGPTAPSGTPYGVALCISTSGFNQLLKSQIECGLLTQEVTEIPGIGVLTGSLLSFFIPELAQFPLSTEYKLVLRPDIAPIVTGDPGPAGELAQLRIVGLEIRLKDVGELLPTLVRFDIDVDVGLDAGLANGELAFSLSAPSADDLTVTFIHNQIGAANSDLRAVVEQLFTLALPLLTDALGTFPLPEFLGLQLDLVEVDQAGEFMSIYSNLVPTP